MPSSAEYSDHFTNLLTDLSVHPCASSLSCVRVSVTPWTVACQAPLSMGILQARILDWVAMPSFRPPALQVNSLPFESRLEFKSTNFEGRQIYPQAYRFRPHSKKLSLITEGFPGGTSGKEPACQCRRHKRWLFDPWVGKIPWRRAWQPTPVFLPGESHGRGTWWALVHRAAKSRTQLK